MFSRKQLQLGVSAAAALATLSLVSFQAGATTIDLTTLNSTGTLNGAQYVQSTAGSGTGVFPAFVQITPATGNTPTESAYNTTANICCNNGSSANFNHEITLSQVPIVTYQGASYRQFLLDINENSGQGDEFLSLDQVVALTSTVPNQSTTPLPTGTVRYDSGAGNEVLLNYALESGSGTADMQLLIPVANFAGALSTDYVFLYSAFGGVGLVGNRNFAASDGFEEWAVISGTSVTVPGPASLAIFGTAMIGFGLIRRRRKNV